MFSSTTAVPDREARGRLRIWKVLVRVLLCVVLYPFIGAVAWVGIIESLGVPLTSPSELEAARISITITGVPSVLLMVVAGLAHKRMNDARFRAILTVPMLMCGFLYIGASTGEVFQLGMLAQLVYVWVAPVRLIRESDRVASS
ncbi:hypothetical protein [Streptomyces sp. UH6]|uniref:hypothetical protein n=1 Tax=Streptomyces sp. UH6 TaxID=2748379 RepID=UPI0015D5122C|nr:hypothetical protein [Streptomyces sp. UH6]NYV73525.1 hypothetical protein [Streptomyces sp. UH6]